MHCTTCSHNLGNHPEVSALLTDNNRHSEVQYQLCQSRDGGACPNDPDAHTFTFQE